MPAELIAALEALAVEVHKLRASVDDPDTGLKAQVRQERKRRRVTAALLALALVAVTIVGVRAELERRHERDRDAATACQTTNEGRAAIRQAFGSLADTLAPPGSSGRPKADAFLEQLAHDLPDRVCSG